MPDAVLVASNDITNPDAAAEAGPAEDRRLTIDEYEQIANRLTISFLRQYMEHFALRQPIGTDDNPYICIYHALFAVSTDPQHFPPLQSYTQAQMGTVYAKMSKLYIEKVTSTVLLQRPMQLPSGEAVRMFEGKLCYNQLKNMSEIGAYYQFISKEFAHPWVFFLQWYIGRQYNVKYKDNNPMASPQLYNTYTPSFSVPKYSVTFQYLKTSSASVVHPRGPYISVFPADTAKQATVYYVYDPIASTGIDEMENLKQKIDELEQADTPSAAGDRVVYGGDSYYDVTPLRSLSDIASCRDVSGQPFHAQGDFLQFFIGSMFDQIAPHSLRAVQPMEYFFLIGVLHGNGYSIDFRDITQVVVNIGAIQYVDEIYNIHNVDHHLGAKMKLMQLKKRVSELELKARFPSRDGEDMQ